MCWPRYTCSITKRVLPPLHPSELVWCRRHITFGLQKTTADRSPHSIMSTSSSPPAAGAAGAAAAGA